MKVSCVEGLAIHNDPESCASPLGNHGREALTGVGVGPVLSRERHVKLRGADPLEDWGRPHLGYRYREMSRDPARSETRSMRPSTLCGSREIPRLARADGSRVRKGNLREEGYLR